MTDCISVVLNAETLCNLISQLWSFTTWNILWCRHSHLGFSTQINL